MFLRTLELEEFRSYHRLRLDLDPRGLRLSGPNTSGKSTLLEAIAMLATTRSPRSSAEREVINWASGEDVGFPPYARVHGGVTRTVGAVEIEIALQADPSKAGLLKKQIKLNGRGVRAMDAVGTLKAVLFSPEDVTLVSGPPSGRRRYLDLTISQIDGQYLRALSRYNRVLAQRNSLLKALARDRVAPRSAGATSQLAFWDAELVAYGSAIVARRWATVRRLATLAHERFGWLTGGSGLELSYVPSLDLTTMDGRDDALDVASLQAVVARTFEVGLEEARVDEVRRGVSVIGPHRDDATFAVDGMDLGVFGSRGQQRLAVVALKLAETTLIVEQTGDLPVLLLDDVLSELDEQHRRRLVHEVTEPGCQLFVTAAVGEALAAPALVHLPLARVSSGAIAFD